MVSYISVRLADLRNSGPKSDLGPLFRRSAIPTSVA